MKNKKINYTIKPFDEKENLENDLPAKKAMVNFLRNRENISEIKIHDESNKDFSDGKYDLSYKKNGIIKKIDVERKRGWVSKEGFNFPDIHIPARKAYDYKGIPIKEDKIPDFFIVFSEDLESFVRVPKKYMVNGPDVIYKKVWNRNEPDTFVPLDVNLPDLHWFWNNGKNYKNIKYKKSCG